MKYLVRRGKHSRFENGQVRTYRQGEAIEPTEAELRAFPGRFEPVADAERDSESGAPEIAGNLPESALTAAPSGAQTGVSAETAVYEPVESPPELSELLSGEILEALQAGGVDTLEKLARLASEPDALTKIKGIGKARARQIREALMAMDVGPEGG